MTRKSEKLIRFFKKQKGIARFSNILKMTIHPDTLALLVKKGIVEKIGRGLYKLRESPSLTNPDLVVASIKAPKGVVCLISALSFHEATDEVPHYVDLAIPEGARANKMDYPPVRYYRFTPKTWKAGIETHEIDERLVRIYSLSKTIADCFKFRNKIGTDVARAALKIAITEKHISPEEIMRYAKICRVQKTVKPILETLL